MIPTAPPTQLVVHQDEAKADLDQARRDMDQAHAALGGYPFSPVHQENYRQALANLRDALAVAGEWGVELA